MLLGLGSPFSQTRVDFNRLHGTDSSSGTNPFTNPTNLNDGNATTHADRAADTTPVPVIVQSSSAQNNTNFDFASPVTAGHLLVIVVGRKDNPPDIANIALQSNHATLRPFTAFAPSLLDPIDGFVMAYRVATGDEQHLHLVTTNVTAAIYELSGFGPASGYEVKSNTGSGSPIVIGSFSVPGLLQIAGISGRDNPTTYTAGAGYTGDYSLQNGVPGSGDAPTVFAMHGTAGATAQATSSSGTRWAGMAVGVTTASAPLTSICQADLGAAYPVNRITLLEATATGTHYAISYSNDGSSWTSLSPTFSAVGALQTYDLAATIAARYWRIEDDHSPAVAIAALSWDTWTIEGFPF